MLHDQFLPDQLPGRAAGLRHSTLANDTQPAASVEARSALSMLVPRLWRIILVVKRRQELRRLGELDDRLLADIGITRTDLTAVAREPLLRDPTKLLAQRARDRRDARQRSGRQFADGVAHPASPSKGESSHVPIKAIYFIGC
jgi:uncharacterized protein YjiS (DUF1127 family)